jgi:tetratricopeptide (TPR) repeat protein
MNINKNLTLEKTFELGVQNQQKNNLDIAQDLYNQILERNPKHVHSLNNLGVIYQLKGDFQKAKGNFEKVIEINPKHEGAYKNLGTIYIHFKKYEEAISCYEKAIIIDPNNGKLNYNLGVAFNVLQDYQKAQGFYEKAITINPNYTNALNNLGLLFFNKGEYQKAQSCYEKAIESNPKFDESYFNLGNLLKKIGKYQEAIGCYEKAIAINPNYKDALCNLGSVLNDTGKYQEAINFFNKAIEIDPNFVVALNNVGSIFSIYGNYSKALSYFEKAIAINPNYLIAQTNLSSCYISLLNLEKAVSSSHKSVKMYHQQKKLDNQSTPIFRFKHDVEQAKYLCSKNYKIDGIDEFQKIGDEILNREENKDIDNDVNKKILLTSDEVKILLPFYKADYIYKPKIISKSCINPNKNWQEVEDEYLNSSNQIMYIDDFLSDEALIELREFCLVSKVWNRQYKNNYLGAFSDSGFNSLIHLQIAIDLQKKLPKLFGPHKLGKFWGFKYDTTLGKGINIHADFAIHNLNFWITPDEYNNNKESGGLKVYDVPAPDNWTFRQYNFDNEEIYKFLNENNANCTNIPYKFNRAVLFNSAYFHETDKIDFKDMYKGRRINNTYLFGSRRINN